MGDVANDKFVIMNLAEHFTTAQETAFGSEIEGAFLLKAPNRQRLLLLIGGKK